jgi:phage gp46-like protein
MSSLIDINAVKAKALKEISDEAGKKATDALVRQLRIVAAAEQVVRAEKLKQADLEAQIADGTF